MTVHDRICAVGDEAAADLDGQIAAHRGMGGIELRTIGSRFLSGMSAGEAARLGAALAEAGLVVPVVDTPVGSWSVDVGIDMGEELRLLRATAQRARSLGCRRLRVMSYPNDGRPERDWRRESLRRMRELTAAAEDLDVVLLHENCHGWASRSAEATIEMLHAIDSPRLRVLFDTGNGLAYGYEAPLFLQAVLPWVEHVHVKDGLRSSGGGDPQYVLPGAGQAGIAVCCEMLLRAGYGGWFSLEPHLAHVSHEGFDAGTEPKRETHRACVAAFGQVLDVVVARLGTDSGAQAA